MRLTIAMLGLELDLTFGLATVEDTTDEYVDAGTTGHYPISFVAHHTVPEEIGIQPHCPAWDEPEERGQR